MKIGVAISGDFKELQQLKKFKPSNFIDLQSYVKKFEIENISLKKMAAIVLGRKISKKQQRSNWAAEELTEAQIIYAATDAWVTLLIFEELCKNKIE
jgi:ribonuclease D